MTTDQTSFSSESRRSKGPLAQAFRKINSLVDAQLRPSEFFRKYLACSVTALEARAGAIWLLTSRNHLELQFHLRYDETSAEADSASIEEHSGLLQRVLSNGKGILVRPHKSLGIDGQVGNPTDFDVLLVPIRCGSEVRGVVEVFAEAEADEQVERRRLEFLAETTEYVSNFLIGHELKAAVEREGLWYQLQSYSKQVHQSLDPTIVAYTIANEGRRILEVDRVAVAVRQGKKFVVEAISGQDQINRRSNEIVAMNHLIDTAMAGKEPVFYCGDSEALAPQVVDAIHKYLDISHAQHLAIYPLNEAEQESMQPQAAGAILVEQLGDRSLQSSLRYRLEVIADGGGVALVNAAAYRSIFLMPLWQSIGRIKRCVQSHRAKALCATSVFVLAMLVLAFVSADLKLHGDGILLPVDRRDVFAGIDGIVTAVHVRHGQWVQKGDLLIELQNTDLDVQLSEVTGQLQTTAEQIAATDRRLLSELELEASERNRLAGELRTLKQAHRSLTTQLGLLQQKQKELQIRSPIHGEVITWQLKDKLMYRPVTIGQVLLSVADPEGAWEIELRMPEHRMGHVDQAALLANRCLPVQYILATKPEHVLLGETTEIHHHAEVRGDDGNVVLVRAAVRREDLDEPRAGASVTARVNCGSRPLGYVLFHDVVAFLQSRILFRFT